MGDPKRSLISAQMQRDASHTRRPPPIEVPKTTAFITTEQDLLDLLSGRPSASPLPPRVRGPGKSATARPSHSADAPPAALVVPVPSCAVAEVQSASPGCPASPPDGQVPIPPQLKQRAKLFAAIPPSARNAWVKVCSQMLKQYAAAHATGDHARLHALVAELLDLPVNTLRTCRPDALVAQMRSYFHTDAREEAAVNASQPQSSFGPASRALDVVSQQIRSAIRHVIAGDVQRGNKALQSDAKMADITPATLEALQSLHPSQSAPLPRSPPITAPLALAVDTRDLVKMIRGHCNNNAAGGPSGWRNKMLVPLTGDDDCLTGLSCLLVDICNGVFQGAVKERLRARTLVPLKKDNGSVRPVGMGEVFYRLAVIYAMRVSHLPYKELFPSIQYGVGFAGGCERVLHQLRHLLHHSPEGHVICSTDIRNAFNTRRRADIWAALVAHDSCKTLLPLFHWAYATPSLLCVYEGAELHSTLLSCEGVVQGDPMASLAFALSMQSTYSTCVEGSEVTALAIQDDLYLCGESSAVLAALGKLEQLSSAMSLQLCREKCQVLPCASSSSPSTLEAITTACGQATVAVVTEMRALGCSLAASGDVVKRWCESGVQQMEAYFERLAHPALPPQIAYTLLRQCAQPTMSYLARVVPSEQFESAARAFDESVVDTFVRMHSITYGAVTDDLRQAVHLPLSMGGIGISSLLAISPAAYTASLLSASHDIQQLQQSQGSHTSNVANQLQSSRMTLQQADVNVLTVCKVSSEEELVRLRSVGKLQHKLTEALHATQLERLRAASSEQRKAALLSAAADNAYRWLVNPLTDARYMILPLQWKLAMRHRLYLPPADVLPTKVCVHKDKSEHALHTEPFHFYVCEKHRKSAGYTRHQHVIKTLQRVCHHLGMDVQYEPSLFGAKGEVLRPDLLIYTAHDQWMIDVMVTEPSGSYVMRSKRTYDVQGAAAKQGERDKRSKYKAAVDRLTGVNRLSKFVPFVMESHGAIGKEGMGWLNEICKDQPLPAACLSTILSQLSAALQIGNAEMSSTGLNSLAVQANAKLTVDVGPADRVSEAVRGHLLGRQKILWNGRTIKGRYRLRGGNVTAKYADDAQEDSGTDVEDIWVPRVTAGSAVSTGDSTVDSSVDPTVDSGVTPNVGANVGALDGSGRGRTMVTTDGSAVVDRPESTVASGGAPGVAPTVAPTVAPNNGDHVGAKLGSTMDTTGTATTASTVATRGASTRSTKPTARSRSLAAVVAAQGHTSVGGGGTGGRKSGGDGKGRGGTATLSGRSSTTRRTVARVAVPLSKVLVGASVGRQLRSGRQ